MAADFRHQLVGQFRHPLDSQPLFFVAALTSRYKLDKKSMRWSFNDSKR
jgi:hypothetical protein